MWNYLGKDFFFNWFHLEWDDRAMNVKTFLQWLYLFFSSCTHSSQRISESGEKKKWDEKRGKVQRGGEMSSAEWGKNFIIHPHNLHLSRRWCNFILLHQQAQLAELNDSYIHLNFISHSSSSVISKTSNLSLSLSRTVFEACLKNVSGVLLTSNDKPPHELHFFPRMNEWGRKSMKRELETADGSMRLLYWIWNENIQLFHIKKFVSAGCCHHHDHHQHHHCRTINLVN